MTARVIADARGWDRLALAAVVAGALVRAVWCFWVHPPLDSLDAETLAYVRRALRISEADNMTRDDAFFPPGTHLLLSAPLAAVGIDRTGLWAATGLWWALSSATPLFGWRLARRLVNPVAGALTAVLLALWPLHVTYAGFFLSETPAVALLAAGLWLGYRARGSDPHRVTTGLAAGLAMGAAIATRPQLALNLLVLLAPFWWRRPGQGKALAAIAVGALVPIGGAVVHNSLAADRVVGPAESAGLVFYLGQCDLEAVSVRPPGREGGTLVARANFQRGGHGSRIVRGRQFWDQGHFVGEGLDCVRDHGASHAGVLARHVLDMTVTTTPWPQDQEEGLRDVARVSNVLYFVLLPAVLIAVAGLVRWRRARGEQAPEVVLLLHLACVVPVALLFLGEPRLRTPYDLFGLALLAAVLASWLFGAPRVDRAGYSGPAAGPSERRQAPTDSGA